MFTEWIIVKKRIIIIITNAKIIWGYQSIDIIENINDTNVPMPTI